MNIAITGSIGTGKSTATKILAKMGYKTYNADEMVRAINSREDVIEKIVAVFGIEVLQSNGELDKSRLRELIFTSKDRREKLNEIIHPEVVKEMKRVLQSHPSETVFMEVPLLFEVGLEGIFDKVVVVACSKALQVERIMKRDTVNQEQAENSVASQMSVEEKIKKADFVVSSEMGVEVLEREIREIMVGLKIKSGVS